MPRFVMPGPVPGIHAFGHLNEQDVDGTKVGLARLS
jgi:hypothetical protein